LQDQVWPEFAKIGQIFWRAQNNIFND
jgi:hypothetical protein